MQRLGPGESLTSGGYVRTAEGKVILPDETFEFVQQVISLGNFAGKTMPEVAAALGNCDPAPARDLKDGYEHSWSRPGYELRLQFDSEHKVTKSKSLVGGPPSRGLEARTAEAVETANLIADSARRHLRWWLVSPAGVTIDDDHSVSVACGEEHLALLTSRGAWVCGSLVVGDFSDDGPQWDDLNEVMRSAYQALASGIAGKRVRLWAESFLDDEYNRDAVLKEVAGVAFSSFVVTPAMWGLRPEVDASTFEFVRFTGSDVRLVSAWETDERMAEIAVELDGTAFFSAFYEVPATDDDPNPNATEFGMRKVVSRASMATAIVECDVSHENEAEGDARLFFRAATIESLHWTGSERRGMGIGGPR